MIILTQSLEQWLIKYHWDIIHLILLGHIELFTDEMQKEYLEWCKTDEGKQYLKGGNKYDPDHRSVKALNEMAGDTK